MRESSGEIRVKIPDNGMEHVYNERKEYSENEEYLFDEYREHAHLNLHSSV